MHVKLLIIGVRAVYLYSHLTQKLFVWSTKKL